MIRCTVYVDGVRRVDGSRDIEVTFTQRGGAYAPIKVLVMNQTPEAVQDAYALGTEHVLEIT